MRKTNVMQIVRLVMMIAAVAGVIYALEYMERGIAVWFWITLLGVGFVGLLYTFRLTQRNPEPHGDAALHEFDGIDDARDSQHHQYEAQELHKIGFHVNPYFG